MNSNKYLKLYEKNYNVFLAKFENPEASATDRLKLFHDFSMKYLPLPELWIKVFKEVQPPSKSYFSDLIKSAFFDFYSEEIMEFIKLDNTYNLIWRQLERIERRPFDRLLNGETFHLTYNRNDFYLGTEESEKIILENLSFPHAKLELVLNSYEEYLGKPVTEEVKQLYQKHQAQYEKIKLNEADFNKWFECLTETLDDRFIIQNVEARIAKEPKNMELWKLYISFLKPKNKRAAYEVYYRFSRLFLGEKTFVNDFEIWKGTKPTVHRNRYLDKLKYYVYTGGFSYQTRLFAPSPLHFQCPSLPPQNFVIPVSMINLMIKNANGKTLQKLYQASKYFFYKTQKPLCHTFHLKFYRKSNYFANSLSLNEADIDFGGLANTSIYHQLIVNHQFPTSDSNQGLLSAVLPKMNIENLKILKIKSQTISTQDYHRLTKHGNIQKIVFTRVEIRDDDGTPVTLEDLLKNLSKAHHIDLPLMASITNNSWEFLENFVKLSKIDFMVFLCCDTINSHAVLKFLFENVHPGGKIFFDLHFQVIKTEYENMVKNNANYPKFGLEHRQRFI